MFLCSLGKVMVPLKPEWILTPVPTPTGLVQAILMVMAKLISSPLITVVNPYPSFLAGVMVHLFVKICLMQVVLLLLLLSLQEM